MNLPDDSTDPRCAPTTRELLCITDAEMKVLLEVANDLSNAEIAEKLKLSRKSVENYRTRIAASLNCAGYGVLARFARRYRAELWQFHDFLVSKLPPPDLVT